MVGNSRPSSRSPTGRGTPLNGVRRRFEACREHDAWHKAMRKRNIANTVVSADHARKEGGKRGCPGNNNIPKKTNYSFGKGLSLFLNRSGHPLCSRSSVESERKSSNLTVVGSNPTGSTRSTRIRQPVCSFVRIGGVAAERSNATVPKTAGGASPRRFESSPLRESRMNRPMRDPSRPGRCALH